jgi:hypothetical protein
MGTPDPGGPQFNSNITARLVEWLSRPWWPAIGVFLGAALTLLAYFHDAGRTATINCPVKGSSNSVTCTIGTPTTSKQSSPPTINPGGNNAGSGSSPQSTKPSPETIQSGAWSDTQPNISANGLTSVSCPSSSFCMAVDSGGNVFTESDAAWSAGSQLDGGSGLTSVSCASMSFCAAITSGDTANIYSDGSWSSSTLTGADGNSANLTAVSCPRADYCIATGDLDAYTYSGQNWSRGQLIQSANDFTSVSCPTPSFCMAVDSGGDAYSYIPIPRR